MPGSEFQQRGELFANREYLIHACRRKKVTPIRVSAPRTTEVRPDNCRETGERRGRRRELRSRIHPKPRRFWAPCRKPHRAREGNQKPCLFPAARLRLAMKAGSKVLVCAVWLDSRKHVIGQTDRDRGALPLYHGERIATDSTVTCRRHRRRQSGTTAL